MSKNVSSEELLYQWERQKGETPKAYEAFCIYRDMLQDRTLRKTSKQLDKNMTTIGNWSSKYKWVERVAAYDLHLEREARKKREKDIIEMNERHATIGTALLVKAAKALNKLPEDKLKPLDISKMVEVGSKLERLGRGESTENVKAKAELTGKDGEPIESKQTQVVIFQLPDNGRDPK